MTLSNLPPGVDDSMIPGNSRDDELIAYLCDRCEVEGECPYQYVDDCPTIAGRHDGGDW